MSRPIPTMFDPKKRLFEDIEIPDAWRRPDIDSRDIIKQEQLQVKIYG